MRTLIAVAVTAFLAAGCLSPGSPAPSHSATGPKTLDAIFAGFTPPPNHDAGRAVAWWENFVSTYTNRVTQTPQNTRAAAFLAGELKDAGYDVDTVSFNGPVEGVTPPGGAAKELMVRGLHKGTTHPDHRLVLLAHYDSIPTTTEAAYDDGSGVANVMELCRILAKVQTNKTIECLFFDAEEEGAVPSGAYTDQYAKQPHEWTWDEAFGFDMTGLNWPGYTPWKLWAFLGTNTPALSNLTADHHELLSRLYFGYLGENLKVTSDRVDIVDRNERSSDELRFSAIGIPVVRFAGGRAAADYPQYHDPGDTTQYAELFACGMCTDLNQGRAAMSAGMDMVVQVAYYTILSFDQIDPWSVPT